MQQDREIGKMTLITGEPAMTIRPRHLSPEEHFDELLDQAGRESFPASDPPAVTPMRGPVALAPDTSPHEDAQSMQSL